MRKNQQSGVAIIEFALILPFLLLLIFITTEVGRALYQYNTLTKSVRDAVRYMSLQTPNTHITQGRNLVVYGNTAGTGTPLALGLSLTHVPSPTWQIAGSGPVINTVTVTITGYAFQSMVPSVFGVPLINVTYNDISATMRSTM